MTEEILITDSLFIFDEHVRQIEDAGFSVVRLDKPCANEKELCQAIKGKVGYILGGVERVTEKVINSADKLKVISFTGSGYTEFIPGHKLATRKGIAITAASGANADAVAEYTLTYILMAIRKTQLLTQGGGPSFLTSKGASESILGVIGYGTIGKQVVKKAIELGFSVLVSTRNSVRKTLPSGARQVKIDTLIKESDVVSIHVDKINGEGVLKSDLIKQLSIGASIINVAFPEAIDQKALLKRIKKKEIYAFFDAPMTIGVANIDPGFLIQSNAQTAFNTIGALKKVSDVTTSSLLNVLENGKDKYLVNPNYKKRK